MSDTPDTDKAYGESRAADSDYIGRLFLMRDHARNLERSRDELKIRVELEISRGQEWCRAFIEMRKERDEARKDRSALLAEVSELVHDLTGENSCEVVFLRSKFDELHGKIDDLRAEVTRLTTACEKEFESVQELSGQVERLKADKARTESEFNEFRQVNETNKLTAERFGKALARIGFYFAGTDNDHVSKKIEAVLRGATIDAAMKGDA